ncbi:MAG: flippase-like domain-containing protein [Flavobacteriales bacterium]|nr:flippase-like domain-containing protein [Flavobacteriales bacterium]MCB9174589.1 flippase-like domain-containing protein [Flavobacteriales bacterium]
MSKSNKVSNVFSVKKVVIPIFIGLLVAGYFLWKKTDWETFKQIVWSYKVFGWLLVAIVMMVIRDFAYMIRIRILTDNHLSWRNSFNVIMLWEFASAITPSVVGGSGVAMFILNKEGISLGKSTAVVMISAFLDELFYIVTVPIVILMIGTEYLFPVELTKEIFGFTLSTKEIFYVGYGFIVLLTSLILYGVFVNPKGIKIALFKLFSFKLLKRWKRVVVRLGNDMITTSLELKNKSMVFWFKAFAATVLSWTARFWVVNFILMAFTNVENHFIIYGRQLVMWVIMLISPTPGGVGIAEFAFNGFLKDFIPLGLAGLLIVLWRLISYYPYLFIGVLVFPNWLKRDRD